MQKHYTTQNSAIATMLACVGARWETDDQGRLSGCRNLYDADTLRKLGYPAGMPLEDAAKDAHASGKKGRVTYSFVQDDTVDRALKAWDEQQQAIALAEATDDWASSVELGIEIEDAARLLCVALQGGKKTPSRRKFVVNLWQKVVPLIAFGGRSSTAKEGGKTITNATGKIMSLNGSEETRKRLKI